MRSSRFFRKALLILLFAGAAHAFAQGSDQELRRKILATAAKYRGVPYMYGAESPSAFDCSGFVRYVYREATGLTLPRSSRGIFGAGESIDVRAAEPGDIFVYDTVGGSPSHVAIYLGDGSVIHAVSEGPHTGVIVSPASDSYFPPRLIAARSFLGSRKGTAGSESAAAPPSASVPRATPVKPVEDSAVPERSDSAASSDEPIVDIGFSISARRTSYTDRIPAAAGTRIAFTVTNDTGTDGRFIVIFYRTDPSFSRSLEIHRETARIASGKSLELPAYLFSEPGIYKLIVKDNWNAQLLERIFVVRSE